MSRLKLSVAPLLLITEVVSAVPGEVKSRLEEGASAPSMVESSHLIDTALGLIVVLGVMLALAWLVKRYVGVPGIAKGVVKVVGGVSLGPRERAVVVSVDGQRLLLGVAPGRVQTLYVLGKDESDQPAFAEQLDQVQSSEQAS